MSGSTNGGGTRAYEALRESEELHRATLSNISDAVFLTDDDGVFTYICPNVDMIFGYVPDEVQAMTHISRLLGDNLFDRAELAARGEILTSNGRSRRSPGEQRTVLVLLKAVSIKGGTVLYTCRDVTERSRAEEELRAVRRDLAHASRLALVGELLASMTHEINQPLTAIVVNASCRASSAARRSGLDEMKEIREILTDIGDEGRVAAAIIDRVRALARKRPLELGRLDVNEVTREMLRLVEGDARRRGIALNAELAPSLPAVHADRVCLQQVMLNLMVNGMDAMDQVEGDARRLVVRYRTGAGKMP